MTDELKEIQKLRETISSERIPEGLREDLKMILDRLEKFSKYGNYSSEYESASKYIGWVSSIPWGKYSTDNLEVSNAKKVLDHDHYGMESVKDRVIEYLSVMNLLNSKNSENRTTPILCFLGLQGIGKTSMAKSIATTLGRSFTRISLGGMPSALELLGRSKSTPDAEPGLIVKALIRAKTLNPVILLDEVDKAGSDTASRASVMASLLEILDPEQNDIFIDNYIGYPVNLSKVFFVLTANNIGGISNALLDRLEIIKLTGYSDEEKEIIAKDYILPKVYENTGVDSNQLSFDPDVWSLIIRPLGYEAGIRELERVLMGIGRKVARQILANPNTKVNISKENVNEYISL